MKLLDRYLIKRLVAIVFFAILVFTLCWLAPETMFRVIQGVARRVLTIDQGVAYLMYSIPEVLTYCLPISMLFGSVFLFRQISLSGELTAMQASGISFRRVLVPVSVVGIVVSLLFFLTQEVLIPEASRAMRELNHQTHFERNLIENPQVTFVEKRRDGTMDKFIVISPTAGEAQNKFILLFYEGLGDKTRINRILTATHGVWNSAHSLWELSDGVEYYLNANGIYRKVGAFELKKIRTSPVPYALLSFPTGNPSEFRVQQLEKYVRLLSHGGQTEDARFYRVRLYQRFALIWAPLLLAVMGGLIGVERSRAKRNLGLTYAAVLLLFYNVLVPSCTTLGSIGVLPAWQAAIAPLVLAGAGGWGILRLRRSEG